MTPDEQALTTQIGLRLRAARKAQGLSLSELYKRTGGVLSKRRISKYEQGTRRLGIEEARALSSALGTVSAAYLLCLDDEEFLSADEWKLVRSFRSAEHRGQRTILGVAAVWRAEGDE
jgi:transcriptional regulator with XRE-family HTH domain